MKRRWKDVQENVANPPKICTFFGRFAGKVDPVPETGEAWIGRVFEVGYQKDLPAIIRHMIPLARSLNFAIEELNAETDAPKEWQNGPFWFLVQRMGAFFIYSILNPLYTLKRSLFGP
jgi:hypothetical protein